MLRWSPFIGLALVLAACSEEAYEIACQYTVLDNRPAYAEASPNFEHELDRTHVFSDGTGQSVTVFYMELADERRVRVSCFAEKSGSFVFAFVRDDVLGPRIVGAGAETLARRPRLD
jgi:fido (protein-threonine AMPylation protein)